MEVKGRGPALFWECGELCLSPNTHPTTTELWHQELVVGLHWAFSNVMTSHLQVRAGRAHYNPPTTALRFAPRSQKTRIHPDRNSHRVALRLTNSNNTFCTPYTQDPDTFSPWRSLLVGGYCILEQALRSSNHFP